MVPEEEDIRVVTAAHGRRVGRALLRTGGPMRRRCHPEESRSGRMTFHGLMRISLVVETVL